MGKDEHSKHRDEQDARLAAMESNKNERIRELEAALDAKTDTESSDDGSVGYDDSELKQFQLGVLQNLGTLLTALPLSEDQRTGNLREEKQALQDRIGTLQKSLENGQVTAGDMHGSEFGKLQKNIYDLLRESTYYHLRRDPHYQGV